MFVRAGLSEAGEAIVAWIRERGRKRELWVAEASAGEPFRTRRLASSLTSLDYDLAVGADGRVLVAFSASSRLQLVEREPGGAWGAPQALAESDGTLAVAVGAGAAAAVAWTDFVDGSVYARTRMGPGAFGPVQRLGAGLGGSRGLRRYLDLLRDFVTAFRPATSKASEELDTAASRASAAVLPDGRALVTWSDAEPRGGDAPPHPHVALLGATTETYALGAGIRRVDRPVPFVTDGGAPAAAWGDVADDYPRSVTHVAVAGVPDAADPPAPKVTIGQPRRRVFGNNDDLVLPVTCSAACDVRAHLAGRLETQPALLLARAGSGELHINPELEPIAPLKAAPVRILIRYGAPGARKAQARTISRTLRRGPSPRVPRARGLTARRDGEFVVVRWHSPVAVSAQWYVAIGHDADRHPVAFREPVGFPDRRREFEARLLDRARKVANVTVYGGGEYASSFRAARVRVR